MHRSTALFLLGLGLASSTLAETSSESAEDRVSKELPPDSAVGIYSSVLERAAFFELTQGDKHITVRVTPDGLLQFLDADAGLDIAVRGTEGNLVSVELKPDERISIWPVERIIVRRGTDVFTVTATAAHWAFVVRADKVRRGGLPARCDNLPCTLRKDERLDTDRLGKRVVFRLAGRTYPGKVVRPRPKKPKKEVVGAGAKKPTHVSAEVGESAPEPVSPGVIAGRARDLPWQTVPLPTVSR